MLSEFDWLRRCDTGAELLATLQYFDEHPGLPPGGDEIGMPHSAFGGPCRRCWIYPRISTDKGELYCQFCSEILARAEKLYQLSRRSVIIWGFVNRLPKHLTGKVAEEDPLLFGRYVHDENKFLAVMHRYRLKTWLKEIVIYYGSQIKGIFQIFPPIVYKKKLSMGDILCRASYHDVLFAPTDQLMIRFYSSPLQLIRPHLRDREGMLTFQVSEFLNLMETASIYKTLLRPEEQEMVKELLNIGDPAEQRFYWGRLQGFLSQKAKDMLEAWKMRRWPKSRIQLLYELINYVEFSTTD